MFTGIVQAKAMVAQVTDKTNLKSVGILFPVSLAGVSKGASVSVNGVCLTVSGLDQNCIAFDLMRETLELTNLGAIKKGDYVNIERSVRVGEEIGGHLLSGHVIETSEIVDILRYENNRTITFKTSPALMKYVFTKGFIALDGCSLTVINPNYRFNTFAVSFIPYTLKQTVFGQRKRGDRVNVEIDSQTQLIVDTVFRILNKSTKGGYRRIRKALSEQE